VFDIKNKFEWPTSGRDVISFYSRGGIFIDVLRGRQNMKKKIVCLNTKIPYFSNQGAFAPPAPPNDVPDFIHVKIHCNKECAVFEIMNSLFKNKRCDRGCHRYLSDRKISFFFPSTLNL